ncbi:hypothetical protein ACQ4LE_004031 [Meloidogyne hapla]|uniref:Uncharacterized protein n=1 Tax=Meloidogyne hapla TaxID=6305 RepID=A0A1I8BUP1_MELHA
MAASKLVKIIFALLMIFINLLEIQSCGPYGGYGGLPFDPSILMRNPQALQPIIASMPPQQVASLLPAYGQFASQYPQYIPVIIGMLTPAQKYALAASPMINDYPFLQQYLSPYGGPQGYGPPLGSPLGTQGFGIPQGYGIPQGQGIPQIIPG